MSGDAWPTSWRVVMWAGFGIGVVLSGIYIHAEGKRDRVTTRRLWLAALIVWVAAIPVMLLVGAPFGISLVGGLGCVGAVYGTAVWFWFNPSRSAP